MQEHKFTYQKPMIVSVQFTPAESVLLACHDGTEGSGSYSIAFCQTGVTESPCLSAT